MSVQKYSKTPSSNVVVNDGADAVSTAEGMARASVNDAIRAMMADIAKYALDHGALTTAGTGSAYTLNTNSQITTLTDGITLTAKAHAASGAGATLNVNALGARPLKLRGTNGLVTAPAGAIKAGDMLVMTYRDNSWVCAGIADYSAVVDDLVTAASILTKLKTVDGAGSGVDADLLDGQQGAFYQNAGNMNAGTLPAARLSGSYNISITGNANTVDNLHAASFLRSDAADTAAQTVTFQEGVNIGKNGGGDSLVQFYDDNSNAWRSFFWDDSANDWRVEDNGGAVRKLWHSGNDGAGSDLDADKLDGLQATSFLRSDTGDAATGRIDFGVASDHQLSVGYDSGANRQPWIGLYDGLTARRGYIQALTNALRFCRDGGACLDLYGAGDAQINGNKIMHLGNDGSGSGFDADKLDGQHASYFATASHSHSHAAFNPTQIGGGQNLNNYQTPGFYWQNTDANAVSGSNYPVDLAGSLIVTKGAGATQTYITYNNGNQRMFFRGLYKGSWSAWREVTVEDKIRNSWAGIRSQNPNGYIDLGPADANYAHIYTDRPEFYFNKQLLRGGNKVWDAGNDGSGSGLDADKVDGLQASSFLRSDASDTASGDITLTGVLDARRPNSSEKIRVNYGGPATHSPFIGFYRGTTREGYIQYGDTVAYFAREGGARLDLYGSGDARVNGSHISHSGKGVNAIGTYAFMDRGSSSSGTESTPGMTLAGSGLYYADRAGGRTTSPRPSGTWRCMGFSRNLDRATLWMRIA